MIHDTAIVSPQAEIGNEVEVGPYAVIDAGVVINDRCKIGPRVTLLGHTKIGAGTVIHTGAVIGDEPQDYHYEGERSYTEIGRNCTIREYVTVHRGAQKETATVVGDNVMLMGLSHIGHNAVIGENVILANGVLIAGHVEIGARAFLSGNVMVHQFTRVGRLAMVGGGCRVRQDLPPFLMYQLELLHGVNTVGLKRAGICVEARKALKQAYRIVFRKNLKRAEALRRIRHEFADYPEVEELAEFIENTDRGIVQAREKAS